MIVSWSEIGFAAFVVIYGFLIAHFIPKRWYAFVNILTAGGSIIYGLLVGLSLDQMGLDATTLLKGISWGLLISIPVIGGITLFASFPRFHKLFSGTLSEHTSKKMTYFELFFRIPFGTALSEEVLFRGILLGLLLQDHGSLVAIVVAALLFGIWHIVPTLNSLKQNDSFSELVNDKRHRRIGSVMMACLVTAVAGIGFGYLRVWSASLIAPWLVHTTINSVAVLSGFLVLHLQKTD